MKNLKKDVVYTAIFGNYDQIPAVNPNWDCDFVCFTDNQNLVSTGWEMRIVQNNSESPSIANRRYKIFPNIYLPEYDRSLYIDGNIKIMADPKVLFNTYLSEGLIAIPKHSERNCAYEEALFCIEVQLVNEETTKKQMARYEAEGFPKKFGLSENSIIFRKHLDSKIVALMNYWWEEFSLGGKRDQLSLQYLIWKHSFGFTYMKEAARNRNIYFKSIPHSNINQLPFFRRFSRKVVFYKNTNYFYKMADIIINIARYLFKKII